MKIVFACLAALALAGGVEAQKKTHDCHHARVLGATWGTTEVTWKIADDYNKGKKTFDASDAYLGSFENIAGDKEVLTVVYEECQNIATVTAKHGGSITMP
eukprot:NODE_9414_length_370_cov_49.538941_g8510_i0.p1 GENE.NODE_9414_length_370_cov_49.538941_g8510_i0~~NODE_9414_length_370_cov_49.538941_g8510_i0.p1  ORF type:complete len:101 (-),score=8.37 NODE_9414_length_370_cov_49.538941_g8510_i0:28-330(-)